MHAYLWKKHSILKLQCVGLQSRMSFIDLVERRNTFVEIISCLPHQSSIICTDTSHTQRVNILDAIGIHICQYILFHAVRKFHNPPSFIRWIPRRVRASCIVLVERRNLFMEIISCLPDRASIMVIYICISFWLLAHVIYLKLKQK